VTSILSLALSHLREGRDVVIIGHPADEASRLRQQVIAEAIREQIRIWNADGDEESPIVRCRPFGCRAVEVDRTMPLEMRPVVLYDSSTRFERGSVREEKVRSVIG